MGSGAAHRTPIRRTENATDVWLFDEPLRIPFLARHSEEVATVNVNGTREPPDWIGHGMDDVVTEREGFAFAQRLGASCLDSTIRVGRQATPQNVVFSPCVDTDHCPHLVIVGHDGHPWSPDDVEDRESGRAVERLNLRPNGFAQCLQNLLRVPDRACYDFTYRLQGCSFGHCGRALSFELLEAEHQHALLVAPSNLKSVWG